MPTDNPILGKCATVSSLNEFEILIRLISGSGGWPELHRRQHFHDL